MVRFAAWSPLAVLFAGAAGRDVKTQADLTTFSIDVENTPYVHAVAFSADSKSVVVGGRGDTQIRLYPISVSGVGEQALLDDSCKATVNAIDFSGDGKWMATSCEDHKVRASVRVYSATNISSTKKVDLVRTFDEYLPFYGSGSNEVVFSFGSGSLSSAGANGHAYVYETDGDTWTNGTVIRQEKTGMVNDVSMSKDGLMLATANYDNTVRLYEKHPLFGWRLAHNLDQAKSRRNAVALSPDGTWVASCGIENEVIFYNLRRDHPPRLAHTLAYNTTRRLPDCRALAFSSDSKRLALGAWDETVRVYRTDVPKPSLEYEMQKTHLQESEINTVSWSQDGNWLASASNDGTVDLWTGFTPLSTHEEVV
jgi:WD40 repeat protein